MDKVERWQTALFKWAVLGYLEPTFPPGCLAAAAHFEIDISGKAGPKLVKARILYWKDVPVQVQVQGEGSQISKQLEARFQQGVDAIAMLDGSQGTDDYLMAWAWGSPVELSGSTEDVAGQIPAMFNQGFPQEFVARIRDLIESRERDPRPGAVDHWCSL